MRRLGLLVLLLLLGGCAYYNGMYNAKRLAGRARKAEREGRTFEATTLWGQVEVRAESVLVRHPRSKWTDEARLLRGTAQVKLRNCEAALRTLEPVMVTARQELADQAAALVGACRVGLGDPAGAASAYARLLHTPDPDLRSLALYSHGRALRIDGRYEEALPELQESSHPRARGERAAALAGLGRVAEVQAVAESLLPVHDTLTPWDSTLAALGRHDREAASALTDRIAADTLWPTPLRYRLLFADALRWRPVDPARSDQRLQAAVSATEGALVGIEAKQSVLLLRLAEADSTDDLRQIASGLEELSESPSPLSPRAAQASQLARRFMLVVDSVDGSTPQGDLRIFIAAEFARDSLAAPRLAAAQFHRLVGHWPDSPFAPKALLALVLLQPTEADSLRQLLVERYQASPYLAMVQGGESPEFQVLEDSLRRFGLSFRPEGRRPVVRPAPGRPQPATPRQPVDR